MPKSITFFSRGKTPIYVNYVIAHNNNAKLWGEALGIGTIADGNEELLTGGTLYTELRPPENGFYIYNGQSTAYNLLALDSAVNALGVEKITDNSGNITYVSNLYKYFKANTTPSM